MTTRDRVIFSGMLILSVSIVAWFARWSATSNYASMFNSPRIGAEAEHDLTRQAFADIIARRNLQMPPDKQLEIAKLFHQLDIWQSMWFISIPIQKNPADLWMMQQIIYETKPDLIVETGTFRGGSALYFAHMLTGMELMKSRVVTIDIEDVREAAATYAVWQRHVTFIHGSSTDAKVISEVAQMAAGKRVMVVLDSAHERDHVLAELQAYAPMVSVGSYIVVEDTNSDGVPVFPGSVGPTAALQAFLPTPLGRSFEQDVSREAMVLTFNPGGWLKRLR